MDRQRRTYQALLVIYPEAYRREYGEPMTQLFVDRLREEGGGIRTVLVWIQILVDLARSAFSERLETTMRSWGTDWWRKLALPMSVLIALAGIGNVFEPEENAGPNWRTGAIAYAAVAVVGLALVIGGLVIRRRNRRLSSSMITVGVLPGVPMTIMFWYPPVAAVGLLSIVIALIALIDATNTPQSGVEPAA